MKIYCILVLLLFLSLPGYSQIEDQKISLKQSFDFIWNARQVSFKEVDQIFMNLSDSLAIEFNDIYPITKIIPEKDSSILVRKLKESKFVLNNSGRGNWINGPRMINYFLESDNFICRVDKLYYSISSKPDHYAVTERCGCLVKR